MEHGYLHAARRERFCTAQSAGLLRIETGGAARESLTRYPTQVAVSLGLRLI